MRTVFLFVSSNTVIVGRFTVRTLTFPQIKECLKLLMPIFHLLHMLKGLAVVFTVFSFCKILIKFLFVKINTWTTFYYFSFNNVV